MVGHVWIERGSNHEMHDIERSGVARFAKSVAAQPDVTFVAIVSVCVDGECKYLAQEVLKGDRDGSRAAIEYAQVNMF